jgi:hypothetical protein
MQTLPNQPMPSAASQAPSQPSAPAAEAMPAGAPQRGDDTMAMLQALDKHIADLPPEIQLEFENGFVEYPKLPEILGMLMPEAYEYFKTIQQGVLSQAQSSAPQGAPTDSPTQPQNAVAAGGTEQGLIPAQAQPQAKATSALGI